ncbi:PIN domain-containing protein [Photobacterium aquae]|uniref:PIN domain-containing protein n=1 Tax=Photobacterium aquae TaxID=1195763 RepID=UPI00069D28CD|nr:PIN domain-containing protein [Photobacterium aquae]
MAREHYIFIDFENLQPKDITLLKNYKNVFVNILVGALQNKISFDFVASVQELNAKYIKINSTGKNALDFHIAYYIGLLEDINIEFSIVSNDKGFDPLIEHIKDKGIQINRVGSIQEALKYERAIVSKAQVTYNINTKKEVKEKTKEKIEVKTKIKSAIDNNNGKNNIHIKKLKGYINLMKNNGTTPKKLKSLKNALISSNIVDKNNIDNSISELKNNKIIKVTGDKITYC